MKVCWCIDRSNVAGGLTRPQHSGPEASTSLNRLEPLSSILTDLGEVNNSDGHRLSDCPECAYLPDRPSRQSGVASRQRPSLSNVTLIRSQLCGDWQSGSDRQTSGSRRSHLARRNPKRLYPFLFHAAFAHVVQYQNGMEWSPAAVKFGNSHPRFEFAKAA